jgi:hypothetical protein
LLSTAEGLASWWTSTVEAEARVGAVARFGFNGGAVVFRMRIDDLAEDERVLWTCLGDFEEWTGTTLAWHIASLSQEPVRSVLSLAHRGWASVDGYYAQCNTDWGRLMYYLKDAAEGRGSGPMMN